MTKLYGLIGNPLGHSHSKDYFTRKFESENLQDCQYRLFQLNSINEFQRLISDHRELKGAGGNRAGVRGYRALP